MRRPSLKGLSVLLAPGINCALTPQGLISSGKEKFISVAIIPSLSRTITKKICKRNRVKKLPVNDDVVYQVFPDLIYTRQQEAIAYLVTALDSDATDCLSADAERQTPISCGYRIMEQLAAIIEGYPLILGESGDIITGDYPAALNIVRKWFQINQTYSIRNDRF